MKLLNMFTGGFIRLGMVSELGIFDVRSSYITWGHECPTTMPEVLAMGKKGLHGLEQLKQAVLKRQSMSRLPKELTFFKEQDIFFTPPVLQPEKILCVGLNYVNHTAEIKMELPQTPVLFSKFNNALAAHRENIPLPSIATKYDYEAELVVVIGKEAHDVPEEQALDYVLGYTIGNDITARELQGLTGQWLLGKSLDRFAPIGPYIVTADEIDPQNLNISLELNGETRQKAHTSEMIFSCAEIISYASRYFTLMPGDLIFTGTPGGVIMGYPPGQREWLKPGDQVTVRIDKLGELSNTFV